MSRDRRGASRCPRAWEVEAARDGRLRAKDVDSLSRHIVGCETCQARQRRLNALGAVLRDLPPVADDLLAARRTRHRLFAEADQLVLQSPDDKARSQRWLFSGVIALASAAALVLSLGVKHWAPSRPVAIAAPSAIAPALQVDVEAQAGAIWHKTQVGSQVRVDLENGEIRARVGSRHAGESLVIRLPDGEIEDLGTVLTVRVEQGHTASVRVFEGRVRLRLRGSTAVELGAGDSWAVQPQFKEATPSCSTAPPPAALKPHASASSTREQRPAEPVTDSPGKQEIRIGTEATLRPSPQQAREEDDAYLHVVELVRAHRFVEARSAAKDYLLRFPKGFRREEVLGVATSVGR